MKNKRFSLAALLVGTALVVSACGTGPSTDAAESPSGSGSEGPVTVRLSALAVGPNAVLPTGIKDGYFERHGLNVDLTTGIDGPAQLPALLSGYLEFSLCNPVSLMIANDKGLDIRLVTSFSNSYPTGEDNNAVVVKKDSGINSFADLAGKTVSVNATSTAGDLVIKEAARIQGADPKDIKFNEIAFPDMLAQLEAGNTQAVWLPEPFLTMAKADPTLTSLGSAMQIADPGEPTQVVCADGKYVDGHPEVVADFRAGLTELLDAAQKDDTMVRADMPDFMRMPADLANVIGIDELNAAIPKDRLEHLNQLMARYGMISKPVDLDKIIAP